MGLRIGGEGEGPKSFFGLVTESRNHFDDLNHSKHILAQRRRENLTVTRLNRVNRVAWSLFGITERRKGETRSGRAEDAYNWSEWLWPSVLPLATDSNAKRGALANCQCLFHFPRGSGDAESSSSSSRVATAFTADKKLALFSNRVSKSSRRLAVSSSSVVQQKRRRPKKQQQTRVTSLQPQTATPGRPRRHPQRTRLGLLGSPARATTTRPSPDPPRGPVSQPPKVTRWPVTSRKATQNNAKARETREC